jgi:hypothetical protein
VVGMRDASAHGHSRPPQSTAQRSAGRSTSPADPAYSVRPPCPLSRLPQLNSHAVTFSPSDTPSDLSPCASPPGGSSPHGGQLPPTLAAAASAAGSPGFSFPATLAAAGTAASAGSGEAARPAAAGGGGSRFAALPRAVEGAAEAEGEGGGGGAVAAGDAASAPSFHRDVSIAGESPTPTPVLGRPYSAFLGRSGSHMAGDQTRSVCGPWPAGGAVLVLLLAHDARLPCPVRPGGLRNVCVVFVTPASSVPCLQAAPCPPRCARPALGGPPRGPRVPSGGPGAVGRPVAAAAEARAGGAAAVVA